MQEDRNVTDMVITRDGGTSWPSVGVSAQCPRRDSNSRTRLRRPALYPLSYEGCRRQHTWGGATWSRVGEGRGRPAIPRQVRATYHAPTLSPAGAASLPIGCAARPYLPALSCAARPPFQPNDGPPRQRGT